MTPLTQILFDRLASAPGGRLPFREVMELALYHPEHGYYGPGPRRIGRSGDFFTAVSVGPLYGQLLADLARQIWVEKGSPAGFRVIEQAAHDGQLMADVLASGADFLTEAWIVEPNPAYQQVQETKLASWGNKVRWARSAEDLPAGPALFLCNELPDAMPVHLIRWDGTTWRELYVVNSQGLQLIPGELSAPALMEETERLPRDLPEGYTTEVNLAAVEWLQSLAAAPFEGVVYIADYGLDAEEYYAPERTTGTLRRYIGHQTDDRVLEDLGQADLTTHVNFTRQMGAAQKAGMKVRSYEHQGRFLGKLGLSWLATLEGKRPDAATQALLRQYQSLTHPAFMGRSFRVLALEKPAA